MSYKKLKNLRAAKDRQQGDFKLRSEDFELPANMRTVFISASPVLTNEVNRYYNLLKQSLIDYLKKKEQGEKEELVELDEDGNEIASEDTQVSEQQKELLKLAQIEVDEIEEELARSAQTDLPNAYEDLKPKHFPMFTSAKQLLYMFDASLTSSFFCRDAKNKIIAMESNLTWHAENKGVFMINEQYKNVSDYDKLLLKFGEEIMDTLADEDFN